MVTVEVSRKIEKTQEWRERFAGRRRWSAGRGHDRALQRGGRR
jgi:hypothetical protein